MYAFIGRLIFFMVLLKFPWMFLSSNMMWPLMVTSVILAKLFQRARETSRRLICSVATEPLPKRVEESEMDAPKEIFLKDYKSPDYYFDTV